MRGATRAAASVLGVSVISIHAPHAGRDIVVRVEVLVHLHISIHAPHAGRDNAFCAALSYGLQFQSTRPMRGATA